MFFHLKFSETVSKHADDKWRHQRATCKGAVVAPLNMILTLQLVQRTNFKGQKLLVT